MRQFPHMDAAHLPALVAGLAFALAFVFGAIFFAESVSLPKVLGVALIVGGFALLNAR